MDADTIYTHDDHDQLMDLHYTLTMDGWMKGRIYEKHLINDGHIITSSNSLATALSDHTACAGLYT